MRSLRQSTSSSSMLTSSSHLMAVVGCGGSSSSSSTLSCAGVSSPFSSLVQRRFRSARYGVKSDEDHIAERARNAALNRASATKKKQDLYEFTGMLNNRANAGRIPLGMGSGEETDRNTLTPNPLMILRKAEEDKGGKIVKAIKKIHGKPDSMQLTEEQQSDLVNAYAETKWFAIFWRPFKNINYTRARRYRLFANIGLCLCIAVGFSVMLMIYYMEMLCFCQLEEEEQVEYRHVLLHVPIGVVKELGDKLLADHDPNETMTPVERCRIIMREMRRLGWTTEDWEVEAPRRFKPFYETFDIYHCFFWCSMWIGSMVSGGGAYYSAKQTFGRLEQQATKLREESKRRNSGFVGGSSDAPSPTADNTSAALVQQTPAKATSLAGWLTGLPEDKLAAAAGKVTGAAEK